MEERSRQTNDLYLYPPLAVCHFPNMKSEKDRQLAKEKAVLLALRKGMALIRRNLKVYGMKVDGSTELISESKDYDQIWYDALKALEKRFNE